MSSYHNIVALLILIRMNTFHRYLLVFLVFCQVRDFPLRPCAIQPLQTPPCAALSSRPNQWPLDSNSEAKVSRGLIDVLFYPSFFLSFILSFYRGSWQRSLATFTRPMVSTSSRRRLIERQLHQCCCHKQNPNSNKLKKSPKNFKNPEIATTKNPCKMFRKVFK